MTPLFAFGMGVPTEWLIIAGIAIVLFGGSKISQFGRGLGEGIREFKKSLNGEEETSTKTTTPPVDTTSETAASSKL